jgi:hypothetical protein
MTTQRDGKLKKKRIFIQTNSKTTVHHQGTQLKRADWSVSSNQHINHTARHLMEMQTICPPRIRRNV